MEVIKVRCPSCKVVMKAKAEYAGRVLKCPGCKSPFIVPKTDGDGLEPPMHVLMKLMDKEAAKKAAEEEEASIPHVEIDETPAIQGPPRPRTLERQNRYMILDSQRMLAYWQAGKGWQAVIGAGGSLAPAKRSADQLPKSGDFRLIEIRMEETESGPRVAGLAIYQLARQYALAKLAGEENAILATITSMSGLLKPQKDALIQAFKTHFLRSAWADSKHVYEYLLGDDYHSSEVSSEHVA